jgi:membrane protease YdiL (CAAX protease family)
MTDNDPGYQDPGFERPRVPHVNGEALQPLPEPVGYLWHPIEPPPPPLELVPPPPPPPKLIPNIGHVAVFLLLLVPAMIGGYLISLLSILAFHPHERFTLLMVQIGRNVFYTISMQAAIYVVLWVLAALVFSLWWHRSFLSGIHWNFPTARHWALVLGGLGVITGLAITIAGNFVPMPKAPPILEDLTRSAAGAWALMAFGVTIAPLTEELAFRGFLLPSLINIFRWLERKQIIGEDAVRYVGIPLSIILTSIPFALMHSEQVSNSWGPVLLIGCVSILLCVIRLITRSVAAGVLVHACYNLTLFAGLLYQTDWFRHLDKLKT